MIRLLLLLALAGCAESNENLASTSMTRNEVMMFGTRHYRGEPTQVFRAAAGALRALDYPIASEAPETGVIVTGRKFIRTTIVYRWPQAVPVVQTRQYVVRLFSDPQTHDIVVTAIPKIFNGEEDISETGQWDLPAERTLWAQLFQQIDLVIPPAPMPPPTAAPRQTRP
jgi:hypothetical protein